MRQFQTTVLDFKFAYSTSFESSPFEAAWASEALYFIRVEEVAGENAALAAHVQISVDGIRWVDEGTCIGPLTSVGDYFMKVSHFGGFLRLRVVISGQDARFQLTNNLVLKE